MPDQDVSREKTDTTDEKDKEGLAALGKKVSDLKRKLSDAQKSLAEDGRHIVILQGQVTDARNQIKAMHIVQTVHETAIQSMVKRLAVVERQAAKTEQRIASAPTPMPIGRLGADKLTGVRL